MAAYQQIGNVAAWPTISRYRSTRCKAGHGNYAATATQSAKPADTGRHEQLNEPVPGAAANPTPVEPEVSPQAPRLGGAFR
jgi:hypothetical protein